MAARPGSGGALPALERDLRSEKCCVYISQTEESVNAGKPY